MFWFFLIAALFLYTATDVLSKKCMENGNRDEMEEMIFSCALLVFAFGIAVNVAGTGKGNVNIFVFILEHPLILLSNLAVLLYYFCFIYSLKFIGLTVSEVFSGTYGLFYFAGLTLFYLFTGKLSSMEEMLQPMRLIPVLIVILSSILLPNIELIINRNSRDQLLEAQKNRKAFLIGILLLGASVVFDSFESVLIAVFYDGVNVSTFDYLRAIYLFYIIPVFPFFIYSWKRRKKMPTLFKNRNVFFYSAAALLSGVAYMMASSYDPVRTGIVFVFYPIVPITISILFLKEKYSIPQYILMAIMFVSTIVFFVADYLL